MLRFLSSLISHRLGLYVSVGFGFCVQVHCATSNVSLGGVHLASSPNGKQIAMSYQGAIAVFNRSDGVLRLLTKGPGWDIQPVWLPSGNHLLFSRSVDFRVGDLMKLDLESATVENLGVRVRGPIFSNSNGTQVLGHFSTSGYPGRIGWFDMGTRQISSVEALMNGHESQIGDAFALLKSGASFVYAIHRDRPGEQTGNRGPQADLWQYEISSREAKRLGRVPSRVFRLAPGRSENEAFMVSDWGGAHNDIWRINLSAPKIGFERVTAGLSDEDWPSVTEAGEMVYSDNVGNATRIVAMALEDKRRTDLAVSRIDFGEPTRVVTLDVRTGNGEEPNIGRVSIRQKNGRFYFPQGSLYRITGGLGHFYGRNQVSLELPYGEFDLVAYKGTEFREVRKSFKVTDSSDLKISVDFEKWVDPAFSQWYSGENHIHANYGYGAWYSDVNTVAEQVEGEGLNVANMVVANSDGDGVFDRPFFIGAPDRRSTDQSIMMWNEEFRSTMWGHLTIVDLDRLVEPIFTGFAGTTNPWDVPTNADVSGLAQLQGASVSYTHPAGNRDDPYKGAYSAKGLPVDAALGVIDTLDVMGFGYDATLPLWYRLLNCGFRIPAAAGTDCFLNRIRSFPPGWGRCYVRLPNELDYHSWIEGQRLGHSFVSTGPMIDFQVNGKRPGESITLSRSGSLQLSVSAGIQSQYPLEYLEIISNGEIVERIGLDSMADGESYQYQQLITVNQSGWLAARVRGGAPSDYVGRRQVAHANPVYLTIEGKQMNAGSNPEYFLNWIDRLEKDLNQRDRYRDRRESVHSQLDEARSVYRALDNE